MANLYNAAIIGCGMAAGGYDELSEFKYTFTHAGAIKKHKQFKLGAISEINETRLIAFQNTWNVTRSYNKYQDLLKNETIDLLCICVPDNLHYQVMCDALKHSDIKHILIEKPIFTNVREVDPIIKLCRQQGVSLYVNYNRRWDPLHEYAKNLIINGFLGQIQYAHGYYVRGIIHNGTTLINTLRMLLSNEIKFVQYLSSTESEINYDPTMDAILGFENGVYASIIAADKAGYGHSIFEIDIMGNKGRICFIDNGYQIQVCESADYKRYSGVKELIPVKEEHIPESQMPFSLLLTLDEIALDIRNKRVNHNHAEDARIDLLIAEALFESKNSNGSKIYL